MKGISGNNNIIILKNNQINIVKVRSLVKILNKNDYIYTPTYSFDLKKPTWAKIKSIYFQNKQDNCYNLQFINNFSIDVTDENSFLNLNTQRKQIMKKNKTFDRLITDFDKKKVTKYIGLYSKVLVNYRNKYFESVLLGMSLTDYAYISSKYIHFKLPNKEKIDYIIFILNKLKIKYVLKKYNNLYVLRIKNIYNFSFKKNKYCNFSINYLGLIEGFINLSSIILIEYGNHIPFLIMNTSYHHIMNLLVFAFSTYGIKVDINQYTNYKNYFEIRSSDRFLMNLFDNIYLRNELKKCLNNEKISYNYFDFYTQTLKSYKRKKTDIVYDIILEDSNNILVGKNGFIPIVNGD